MRIRKLAFLLLALVLFLGLATPVLAHARLLRAVPADGSHLPEPPKQLRLVFNSLVETRFGRFSLRPETGPAIALSLPAQKTRVTRELVLPLPPLDPGRYTLTWSVVARDSHRVDGTLSFTVD